MKDYAVRFTAQADRQVSELYAYIADHGGASRAQRFVGGVVEACLSLRTFPERGHRRDDVRPGLRITGYARRVAIAFSLDTGRQTVVIHGVFYGRQDFESVLSMTDD